MRPLDGEGFSSVALAGSYLLVNGDKGDTLVLEPGPEYREVAHSRLDPFRMPPLIVGKRMYVRCREDLYCIGLPDGG